MDNGSNEGATPVAALEGGEGSEIPEAPPKKNQKPAEPPVTFRDFDVSCIPGILEFVYRVTGYWVKSLIG